LPPNLPAGQAGKNLKSSFSLPLPAYALLRSGRQGEAGGRGVWSLPFRPPSPDAISVRIFSNRHRQLVKAKFGSPADFRFKIKFFAFVPQSGTPEAGFSKF